MDKRRVTVGVVVGSAIAVAAGFWFGRGSGTEPDPAQGHNLTKTLDGRQIPASGVLEFPNSVGHPGNPEEAVKDFKRIFEFIDRFRIVHGKLPGAADLFDPKLRSEADNNLSREDLKNPDWKFSEKPDALAGKEPPNSPYALNFLSKRPDGAVKPAFPKEGERDVWLYSDLTARSNLKRFPDGSTERRFSGVYVVLFSDGKVEKFKHKDLFYVDHADLPGPVLGFPGMTGYKEKKFEFEDAPWNKPSAKHKVTYED